MADIWIVIPAAGKGSRFSSDLPKQYHLIDGKTVLEHTIACFAHRADVKGIVVAISTNDEIAKTLIVPDKLEWVVGGAERSDSVLSAIEAIADRLHADDLIAVHDAARPCVKQSMLNDLFACARESGAAMAALACVDTVKQSVKRENHILSDKTLDRQNIWLAHTPQVFSGQHLHKALQYCVDNHIAITDDASAMEHIGVKPVLVNSHRENIKITHRDDLDLAAFFLAQLEERS